MLRLSLLLASTAALLPLAGLAQPPPAATPSASATVASTASAPATASPEATPTLVRAEVPGKITYSACHVDGPYIAMTFDDGPHAANTPRLLDMLKERKIHATFFLVGENAAEYPGIIKRIIAEGHEVGNHSYTHPQLSKMTDEGVRGQLQKTQDAIIAAGAPKPTLMRPPYGAFTARQQRWSFGEFGYKCILWDVDPLDWKVRNAAHVEAEILRQTVAGSIILSHDIHKTTVDAMPTTLDALKAKGFKFVTVSELIAMDRPVPPKAKTASKTTVAATPAASSSVPDATPHPESTPAPVATAPSASTPAPKPVAPALHTSVR